MERATEISRALTTPEAVVEASLAELRLGELICVPTLDDPALLRHIDESQRPVLEHSQSGSIAERYVP